MAAVATYVRHTSDATRQIAQSGKLRATAKAEKKAEDSAVLRQAKQCKGEEQEEDEEEQQGRTLSTKDVCS